MHGIPVGIKDVIQTADLPTEHNSPLYAGHRPGVGAACVSLLRSAGAVILGKTETVEFAAGGRRALTHNPWNREHTPGGSSSGSGAAIADRHVPLALGTQTGGSTIRPASLLRGGSGNLGQAPVPRLLEKGDTPAKSAVFRGSRRVYNAQAGPRVQSQSRPLATRET